MATPSSAGAHPDHSINAIMTITRIIYGALAMWLVYDGYVRSDSLSFVLAGLLGLMAWRNVSCPMGLCAPAAWQKPPSRMSEEALKQEVEFEEI